MSAKNKDKISEYLIKSEVGSALSFSRPSVWPIVTKVTRGKKRYYWTRYFKDGNTSERFFKVISMAKKDYPENYGMIIAEALVEEYSIEGNSAETKEEIAEAIYSVMNDAHSCSIATNNIDSGLKETQSIRHLIDIMERNIKGELTEQDKIDLKENAKEWSRDIEVLVQRIGEISK